MATKSFTTVMKFNRKNANVLLKALENDNKANKTNVQFNVVRNDDVLKVLIMKLKS